MVTYLIVEYEGGDLLASPSAANTRNANASATLAIITTLMKEHDPVSFPTCWRDGSRIVFMRRYFEHSSVCPARAWGDGASGSSAGSSSTPSSGEKTLLASAGHRETPPVTACEQKSTGGIQEGGEGIMRRAGAG